MAKVTTKKKAAFYDRPQLVSKDGKPAKRITLRNSSAPFDEKEVRAFGNKTRASFNKLARQLVRSL